MNVNDCENTHSNGRIFQKRMEKLSIKNDVRQSYVFLHLNNVIWCNKVIPKKKKVYCTHHLHNQLYNPKLQETGLSRFFWCARIYFYDIKRNVTVSINLNLSRPILCRLIEHDEFPYKRHGGNSYENVCMNNIPAHEFHSVDSTRR